MAVPKTALRVQTPLCPRLPPATKKHQEAKKQTWHSGQTWTRQKRDKIRLAGPQHRSQGHLPAGRDRVGSPPELPGTVTG